MNYINIDKELLGIIEVKETKEHKKERIKRNKIEDKMRVKKKISHLMHLRYDNLIKTLEKG
jgi:hypothetical protein